MSNAVAEAPDRPSSSIKDAIKAYVDAGNSWQVPHIEIAAWICSNDLFDVPFETKLKQCDKLVADALKGVEHTDRSGRKARTYGCARGKWVDPDTGKERQTFLWDDMRMCSAKHAHAVAHQIHSGVTTDVRAHVRSIASWNDENPNLRDNPIQLSWDFSDVADDDSADPKEPR